ncbi:hypothetical protein [Streptomyces brevispora]|uniref:Uncharacterized protein n=1 Tax=Streptomyces brevispora TaxID=887462 RepID=A0ABZ1G646_9ACTN|nr:hypothetical protein [Streptomyces brevispora]WSC14609.1 hypothetical protein OIE64_18385 [Streptomyces brevispora]
MRYDVEFANEPTVDRTSTTYSYGATRLCTPARYPLTGSGEFTSATMYNGRPSALRMGGVPVSWTNRHEGRNNVRPVHAGGGFCTRRAIRRRPETAVVPERQDGPASRLPPGLPSWLCWSPCSYVYATAAGQPHG